MRQAVILLAIALAAGCLVAWAEGAGPTWLAWRWTGCVAVASMGLSMWLGSVRPPAGLLVAVVLLVPEDRPPPVHPAGAWAPLLLYPGLLGAWASVPDTEPALTVAGCLLPVALVRLAQGRHPGVAASWSLVALGALAGALGSNSRAVGVAAAAGVGVVAVAPIVAGFRSRPLPEARVAVLAVVQLAVALPVARLVMGRPVAVVLAVTAVALLVEAVAVWAVVRGVPEGSAGTTGTMQP